METNNKQQIPFKMLVDEESQASHHAISPNSVGQYLDPNTPSLESRLEAARKSFLKERLQNNYPLSLTISYIVFMSIVSLIAIILQSIIVTNRIGVWEICNGFWVSVFIVFTIIINLLLSNFFKLNNSI